MVSMVPNGAHLAIERIGPDVHRCEFGLSRPGIVVGFVGFHNVI